MDYQQPLAGLIPGARGRVLQVLAGADQDLPLSVLGRLAHVSVNQVPRVVDDLTALGVVTQRKVPPTTLVALERRNLVAQLVVALANAHTAAIGSLRDLVKQLRPTPRSVIAFGSFAAGTAGPESDIDIAIAHADEAFETEEWARSLATFVDDASATLGNVVSVTEVTASEIAEGVLDQPFWQEVQATQLLLSGSPLTKDLL